MNILIIYDDRQTYTNTVFEHLVAFKKYSSNNYFFCGLGRNDLLRLDLSSFDALCVHYSIRLPHNGLTEENVDIISKFSGFKFAFLQDEYEHTNRAIYWINRLRLNLVFTVVPQRHIEKVYSPERLPGVSFISNLTGYVPENIPTDLEYVQPSKRHMVVGYRGRTLPLRFGSLGFEKISIGQMVKAYCDSNSITNDIAWDERARIYGDAWYSFVASCKCTLGTESGSNIFDWNGDIDERISEFRRDRRKVSDIRIYQEILQPLEIPGLMNQISPKIFEAISLRTGLILYEGSYSSILSPWKHFIPLKKDGSNLSEVFDFIKKDFALDEMVNVTYDDIIANGSHSYNSFLRFVDAQIKQKIEAVVVARKGEAQLSELLDGGTVLTTAPVRARSSVASRIIRIKIPNFLMTIATRLPVTWISAIQKQLRKIERRN